MGLKDKSVSIAEIATPMMPSSFDQDTSKREVWVQDRSNVLRPTELDPAKRFVNFNEFMETFYNCKTLEDFYEFIKNPEIIEKEKLLYQKKIDELNQKINRFSLNQNSVDGYISEINKILTTD